VSWSAQRESEVPARNCYAAVGADSPGGRLARKRSCCVIARVANRGGHKKARRSEPNHVEGRRYLAAYPGLLRDP
jgi:hypothetical protein